MRFRLIFSILVVLCGMRSYAQSLTPAQFVHADSLITAAIADSLIPGAVLCVVDSDSIAYLRAYGHRAVVPSCEPMTTHTIFDLASLSKPLGAGSAALLLIQQGRLSADDQVNRYLPHFQTKATIRDLLTHRSGLPPYMNARVLDSIYTAYTDTQSLSRQDFLLDTICRCQRLSAPGERYRYSCLNFITLQRVVEAIVGENLQAFLSSNLYAPLRMDVMGWLPSDTLRPRIAPTECTAMGDCFRGVVHDPLARIMMCGLSGNAGLFATAEDVAAWSVWFMSLPDSVRRAAYNAGLWSDDDDALVELRHTGYTGTSIALYPDYGRAVILLINRVHPIDRGNLSILRQQVNATFRPDLRQ